MSDDGVEVTYHPGPGDPKETTWRGQTFKAGETRRIKDAAHLGAIEGNKFFRVNRDETAKPESDKSADDHRRDFSKRIMAEKTVEGVIRAFAVERKRREEAGIGEDDIKALQTQMEPTLRFMRMREGMGDRQVAELWMKHGMSAG